MAFAHNLHEERIEITDAAIQAEVDRLLALVDQPSKATPWRQRLYSLQEKAGRLPGAYILRVGGKADGTLERWDGYQYALRPFIPGSATLDDEDAIDDTVVAYEILKACELAGVDFVDLYLKMYPKTARADIESYAASLKAHPGIEEQLLWPMCPLETVFVLILHDMKLREWEWMREHLVAALATKGMHLQDWQGRVKQVREMALGQYGLKPKD